MDAFSPLVRPAAVAGLFYPNDRATLLADIGSMLEGAAAEQPTAPPKALIVPHAGYIYSGPIAATAYAQLRQQGDGIRRVVLLGPSHHVAFHGIALPHSESFETPLGKVALDHAAIEALSDAQGVIFDDRPHAREHSLEVQLPFLQRVLRDFRIVPLCIGQIEAAVVGELLETLWGGAETLIVISSDLSHYHPYEIAKDIDRRSLAQICSLSANLVPEQACGSIGINALLLAASQHGLIPVVRDIRNSGDTAGDRSRVVGYAAVSFLPALSPLH